MIIYSLTFPNKKIYIGQTIQKLDKRISDHFYKAKNGIKTPLYAAIRKYGKTNIIITELCGTWDINLLNELEIEFINNTNCLHPNGYNLEAGGKNSKWSEYSKEKLSKTKKGIKYLSDEHYKRLSVRFTGKGNPFYGKTHSAETRLKISQNRKYNKLTTDQRLKISKSNGGKIIKVYNKDTNEFIGKYSSASECARQLSLNVAHVCSCVRGNTKLKSHKGYIFKGEDHGCS